MAVDITVRWGGPSDATSGSTYKVERSLNLADWTTLAANQAATTPYVSPSNTLASSAAYGATTVTLTSGTAFSTTGYGWLDGAALIQWTGKSTNQLTGVTWHSGYGTYTTGTTLVEAHEFYADTAVEPSANAVVYRITHTDSSSRVSAPAYLWFYYPPTPESSNHCVVVAIAGTDLGIARVASAVVTCTMSLDDQFDDSFGAHLDMTGSGAANSVTTNAMGLAHFHCWKNSARRSSAGTDASYTFVVGGYTVAVSTVPDRDWVLLSDIADA
jgi:hypothetical protein